MSEGITKAVWLHLLKQGGRWSAGEMGLAINGVREGSVFVIAKNMVESGSVKRYEKTAKGDRVTFGVTKDCVIPRGITVAELMEIGIVKEKS